MVGPFLSGAKMAGTLSPFNMAGWVVLPALPNGNIPAWTISADGSGSLYYADAIKWSWDVCFTVLGGMPLVSDDFDACSQLLDTGGLWDIVPPGSLPGTGTFAQIRDGGSWESPQDHQISYSSQGVSAAVGYYLSGVTTRDAELSTRDQLWGQVLSWCQSYADMQFTDLPTPPAPAPRPPAWQAWPPLNHDVRNGLGLFLAHASRNSGYITPDGKVRLSSVPVP